MANFIIELRRRLASGSSPRSAVPATDSVNPNAPSFDTSTYAPTQALAGRAAVQPYGEIGAAEREFGNHFNWWPQRGMEVTAYNEGCVAINVNGTSTITLDPARANIWVLTVRAPLHIVMGSIEPIPDGQSYRPRSHDLVVILDRKNPSEVTLPSVLWPGGVAPELPEGPSLDRLVFQTFDGGTTWLGNDAGLNFS